MGHKGTNEHKWHIMQMRHISGLLMILVSNLNRIYAALQIVIRDEIGTWDARTNERHPLLRFAQQTFPSGQIMNLRDHFYYSVVVLPNKTHINREESPMSYERISGQSKYFQSFQWLWGFHPNACFYLNIISDLAEWILFNSLLSRVTTVICLPGVKSIFPRSK